MSGRRLTRRSFLASTAAAAAASSITSGNAIAPVTADAPAGYDPTPPPSPWGSADEAGNTNLLTPEKAVKAKKLIKSGIGFVLAHESENGMPLTPTNTWVMTLKASVPAVQQVANVENIVADFTQDGTQFDAICHMGYLHSPTAPITETRYYNQFTELEVVGAEGLKKGSVDKLKPYFTKGILIDVCRHLFDNQTMPESKAITLQMFNETLAKQGLSQSDIDPGDVVLFRTGWERKWSITPGSIQSTLDYYKGFPGVPGGVPGLSLDVAIRLTELRVAGVGADNWGVDALPAVDPPAGVSLPVHNQLLTRGIPLFESLVLEALSEHLLGRYTAGEEDAYHFAFVFAPIRVKYGTGSPASPLAYT